MNDFEKKTYEQKIKETMKKSQVELEQYFDYVQISEMDIYFEEEEITYDLYITIQKDSIEIETRIDREFNINEPYQELVYEVGKEFFLMVYKNKG